MTGARGSADSALARASRLAPRARAGASVKAGSGSGAPMRSPARGGILAAFSALAGAVLRTRDLHLDERMGIGPVIKTERLLLRPPRLKDFVDWREARRSSMAHLAPWEPSWSLDHLTISAFRRRIAWSASEIRSGRAFPLLVFRRDRSGGALVGGVTIENVRRGAAQSAALGYWLSVEHTGRGYMGEALDGVIAYAFDDLDLSRLEAACVAHNFRSRRVLERAGFHVEGLARAYLQINGAWRDHVLYERRRSDRL